MDIHEIRLQDELARLIALIIKERERLEKLPSQEILANINTLTKAFESASRCKLALDKAQATREANLTPEQELKEVITYILSYTPRDRFNIINDLIKSHNINCIKLKRDFLIRIESAGI